ncbi:MAG TPA: septum formation initiator family protein [Planctomycetaceae bacterium]|nr:septum formation initiator family protein [Planctomycetaceae bacterium]
MPASDTPPNSTAGRAGGLAISLAFWMALVVAALLFATVNLSPRLATLLKLRDEHYANQIRLVALEKQARQLERVVEALEHDPAFAAEMARLEFDALRPGEEVISVDRKLALDARHAATFEAERPATRAWYLPAVELVATSQDLRNSLLLTAAVLVIVSFTWLQESTAVQIEAGGRALQSVWGRYRRRSE